jgi:hypothetical protein
MSEPRRSLRAGGRRLSTLAALGLAVAALAAPACRSPRPAGEPAAAPETAVVAPAPAGEAPEAWGVPPFPGAEPRPDVAAAIGAYYEPGIGGPGFAVAVYETDATFDEVHDFYGPRMEAGKWGWRRKSLALEHQTRTLTFLRDRLVAERGEDGRLPAVFAPLLGDPDLDGEEVAARLAALAARHPDASVQVVEGVRPIDGDRAGADVRVLVERPYVDLTGFRLVDRTRIQLLRLPPAE